jgi:hypothetical protein
MASPGTFSENSQLIVSLSISDAGTTLGHRREKQQGMPG